MPADPVTAVVEGNVLQIVFMAAVAGGAALAVGKPAEPFLDLNRSVLAVVQKALWWVIRLAPLGTLGLIGSAVAEYGWDLLSPLATFAIDVYAGCAIVMFVVYPALLALVARVNPIRLFTGAWPAIQLAFVSRSSVGTMPLTQRVVVDRLASRPTTRRSRSRSAPRRRWTAARRCTRRSPRSSSRRSSASRSGWRTTC